MNKLNRILSPALCWLLLMLLSLSMFLLGEQNPSPQIISLILLISVAKACLIILGYMELAGVRHLLKRGMLLYTPLLLLIIGGLLML
ncbi:cytochrome C oxidase subunit IV family protein [Marinobacterium jannaschii]|uniref:cytochrome C oxidase subunit IV family protein n=1 Tax=Marinobacterium jannaschii TaxID=64970 RepID=UPI000480BB5B|nr:cytochrome C oxidase subunit IV family protein [Marinobacterium jannaschii]